MTVDRGGVATFDHAAIHWGTVYTWAADDATPRATISAARSSFTEAVVELTRGAIAITSSTFTRARLELRETAKPLLQDNTFVDGGDLETTRRYPVFMYSIGDLADVRRNTTTGTGRARVIDIVASTVATSWTVDPGAVYAISNVLVASGGTMTVGPGALVKSSGLGAPSVLGTLAVAGTATDPAVMTAAADDSIGGDTDYYDDPEATPTPSDWRITVDRGGVATFDRAAIHWGTVYTWAADDATPRATISAARSSFTEAVVELTRGAIAITSSTFTRARLELRETAKPLLQDNTFVDGGDLETTRRYPVFMYSIGDLADVRRNTTTGTGRDRVIDIVASTVATSWTVDPASYSVYSLYEVTVVGDATLAIVSGAILKNSGAISVSNGGTATIDGATLTALGDDSVAGDSNGESGSESWPGINAALGSTVAITGSDLKHADIGIETNQYADVSANGSTFTANSWDISTGYKDSPGGSAVDAHGPTSTPGSCRSTTTTARRHQKRLQSRRSSSGTSSSLGRRTEPVRPCMWRQAAIPDPRSAGSSAIERRSPAYG